jgi:tRNA pseudouridine13 synthase
MPGIKPTGKEQITDLVGSRTNFSKFDQRMPGIKPTGKEQITDLVGSRTNFSKFDQRMPGIKPTGKEQITDLVGSRTNFSKFDQRMPGIKPTGKEQITDLVRSRTNFSKFDQRMPGIKPTGKEQITDLVGSRTNFSKFDQRMPGIKPTGKEQITDLVRFELTVYCLHRKWLGGSRLIQTRPQVQHSSKTPNALNNLLNIYTGMYVLKSVPEDFLVDEIPLPEKGGNGAFCYFVLKKRNLTTHEAIKEVAVRLDRREKDIGFAGTKDRIAITTQLISVRDAKNDFSIDTPRLKLDFYGRGKDNLRLGDLKGNRFTITIRKLEAKPEPITRFKNYFGEQRFSTNNHEIGRLIVKKKFKEAVDLIIAHDGRWEQTVKEYIKKKPTDAVGAIRTIPKSISLMLVHSYQSYIWNKAAEAITTEEDIDLPLIGFATNLRKLPEEVQSILKEERLAPRDFIIRQIPGFAFEGSKRKLYTEMKDLIIDDPEPDERFEGKKKVKVAFSLDKGCYATVAINQLLS